jgi:hypothetical protein
MTGVRFTENYAACQYSALQDNKLQHLDRVGSQAASGVNIFLSLRGGAMRPRVKLRTDTTTQQVFVSAETAGSEQQKTQSGGAWWHDAGSSSSTAYCTVSKTKSGYPRHS